MRAYPLRSGIRMAGNLQQQRDSVEIRVSSKRVSRIPSRYLNPDSPEAGPCLDSQLDLSFGASGAYHAAWMAPKVTPTHGGKCIFQAFASSSVRYHPQPSLNKEAQTLDECLHNRSQ